MARRLTQSLGDLVAIAIGPALIMTLVTSLVFFLLAILYRGEYTFRLQWILFFFVFGTVLIARLSMDNEIASRASLYGFILAGLVFIGLQTFVEYESDPRLAPISWAISLLLIVVIWFSSHKLTWDCTHIDDKVEATGEGLLEAAGLVEGPPPPKIAIEDAVVIEPEPAKVKPTGSPLDWWDRYSKYRAEKNKRHTPGVWVVYFSLAALPLFGLGQALVPADDAERRQYTFWLMAIYVASGLCLLMTTSYLGLRRYLRQRNLTMPKAITARWLGMGAGLTLVLVAAGALLPRPYPEYSLISFTPLGSPDLDASDADVLGDNPGKDEGAPGDTTAKSDQKGAPSKDGKSQTSKEKGNGKGKASKEKGGDKSSDSKEKGDSSGESKTKGDKGSGQDKDKDKTKDKSSGDNSAKGDKSEGESKHHAQSRQVVVA